jgi:hypothetical protein
MTEQEQLEMKRLVFEIELNLAKLDVYNRRCFMDSPPKYELTSRWQMLFITLREYRAELEKFEEFKSIN